MPVRDMGKEEILRRQHLLLTPKNPERNQWNQWAYRLFADNVSDELEITVITVIWG